MRQGGEAIYGPVWPPIAFAMKQNNPERLVTEFLTSQIPLLNLISNEMNGSEVAFMLNYRPKWLTNPNTGRRLELDICIVTTCQTCGEEKVIGAIECNGPFHRESYAVRQRDVIKLDLMSKLGYALLSVDIDGCDDYINRSVMLKVEIVNFLKLHLKMIISKRLDAMLIKQ